MAKEPKPAKRARAVKQKKLPSIDRDIRFFRAEVDFPEGKEGTLDLANVFEMVDKLPWKKGGKRYLSVDDEHVLSSWIYSAENQKIILGTIRRTGLPLVEDNGQLLGLGLTENQGLCERMHIQVFPNNIVGIVFNFYGPRASQLHTYLESTGVGSVPTFKLNPLIRKDATIQLKGVSVIRTLEMAIHPSYVSSIKKANVSLGKAYEACIEAGATKRIGISLVSDQYKEEGLGNSVLQTVRKLLRVPDLRDHVDQLRVKVINAETDKIELIDLLSDQFVTTKSILRLDARSRALNDESAFGAIQSAYDTLKIELEAAASVETA